MRRKFLHYLLFIKPHLTTNRPYKRTFKHSVRRHRLEDSGKTKCDMLSRISGKQYGYYMMRSKALSPL